MTPLRSVLLCLLPVSGTSLAIACSASDPRITYEPEDAGPDVLFDASVPDEGGTTGDARSHKPPFDPADEPVSCTNAPCAVDLVAGENHFCARMNDGTVRCWGDDTKGSLGRGEASSSPDAGADGGWLVSRVAELQGVLQLSAGGTTTCAVVTDGSVRCWGGNDRGQLGLDTNDPVIDTDRHPTPSPVALPGAAKRVDVGPASACALLANGELWCWGESSHGQLARPPSTAGGVPAKAAAGELGIVAIAVGSYTGLALTQSGDVLSWGAMHDPEGSLAGRASSLVIDPRPFAIGLGAVDRLEAGPTTKIHPPAPPRWLPRGIGHACAIVAGDLFCWGDSLKGALGMGIPELVAEPRRTELESTTAWAQQIAIGGDLTCVRLTDGSVECAGDNSFGALGRDPAHPYATYFGRAVGFDEHAVKVAAATHTVCALVRDGSVHCWGSNGRGELGQGTIDADPHASPVRVRLQGSRGRR